MTKHIEKIEDNYELKWYAPLTIFSVPPTNRQIANKLNELIDAVNTLNKK